MLGGFHALRGVIDSVNKLFSVQGCIPVAPAQKQVEQIVTFTYFPSICLVLVQSPYITPSGVGTDKEKKQSMNTQKVQLDELLPALFVINCQLLFHWFSQYKSSEVVLNYSPLSQ